MTTIASPGRVRRSPARATPAVIVVLAVAFGWLVLLSAHGLHHHGVHESATMAHMMRTHGAMPHMTMASPSHTAAASLRLVPFLIAWQAMVVAMMLPTALPMLWAFDTAARGQRHRALAFSAFLVAYLLTWSIFGFVAVGGDRLVHQLVDSTDWLHDDAWLVSAATLSLAGGYQLSRAKAACLDRCRHPVAWLTRYYRRGVGTAFTLGVRHGAFCLGCCWALMLVMFGLGIGSIWPMVALTAVMTYEKIGRRGPTLRLASGVALLVAAGTVTALAVA